MKLPLLLFLCLSGKNAVQAQDLMGGLTEMLSENGLSALDILWAVVDKFDLENLLPSTNSTLFNFMVEAALFLNQVDLEELEQQVSIAAEETECTKQLQMMFDGVLKGKKWALNMLDATAKPQSGLWYGNIMHIGNYDECLSVSKWKNGSKITGKYCSAVINREGHPPTDPTDINRDNVEKLRLSYGVCIPMVCSAEDMNKIIASIADLMQVKVNLYFVDEFCDYEGKSTPFTKLDIAAIAIFGTFAVIIFLSTSYDILLHTRGTSVEGPSLLIAFSMVSNGKKIFSTKTTPGAVGCLNGMKVISMIWIIFCHRYMYDIYMPVMNMRYFLTWKNQLYNSFVFGGNMAVDTFFVISGFLVIYMFLSYREKGIKTNWFSFYVHRILRLTPSLAMMVLFYATLFVRIGSGPFWFLVHYFFQERCQTSWWSTLLYVQNYATPVTVCVGQSWYLAVDTQLYFISPIILLSLSRWPKKTIAVLLAVGTASCGYTFKVSYDKATGPGFFGVSDELFKMIYATTHTRCSPWLLGIITGYSFFSCRNKRVIINKIVLALAWILSLCTLLGIVFYHKFLTELEEKYVVEGAVFNGFLRPVWSLGVSVIIFICATGNGGLVNDFLSCRAFHIMTRLNYSMYLVHIAIIVFFVGHTKTPIHVSNLENYHAFWGDLAYTLMVSTVWTLAFESPVIVLEKLIFGKSKEPKPQSNGETKINNCSNNSAQPTLVSVKIISKNTL